MVKSDAQPTWEGAKVRAWLDSRIAAARANQVAAQRSGRGGEDECDAAAAKEMVCAALTQPKITDAQGVLLDELKALLDRDDYVWRGVYNDDRFDRHVRSYLRKLIRMAKTNAGFDRTSRYQ